MFKLLVDAAPLHALNDCRLLAHTSPRAVHTDCRLVPPSHPRARFSVTHHSAVAHPSLRTLDLEDGEHVVAFVPSVSALAVLNRAALALLRRLPLATPPDAGTAALLDQLASAGLLDSSAPPAPRPQPLTAWLHLTNACNLRCGYCYIRKSEQRMSPAVARGAVDAVFQAAATHGYSTVALKYAGGEPTLALPLLEDLHSYASGWAERSGRQLIASVLSNGTTLTAANLRRLRALDVGLTISLDSLGAAQDQQRPTVGGAGSLGRVVTGIERALDHELRPHIAVTVTVESVASLPELAAWLLTRDLTFSVSFARPLAAGGQPLHDDARLIAGMRALYAVVAANPPAWSVLGALLDRTDSSTVGEHSCSAGHDYLVFDAQGRLAKCQMEIERPLGHHAGRDPIALIRADQIGLRNLSVDAKEGCRSCEWRYWCGGGCPVAVHYATGRYDLPSPSCAIYKTLYPDLLRLEGRRILAQCS